MNGWLMYLLYYKMQIKVDACQYISASNGFHVKTIIWSHCSACQKHIHIVTVFMIIAETTLVQIILFNLTELFN